MATYDVYTVVIKTTHSGAVSQFNRYTVEAPTKRWTDYSFHGAFIEDAKLEADDLKEKGLTVAIRTDTYKRNCKSNTLPIKSTFELI